MMGQRVKKALVSRGMKQKELAAALGVPPQTISYMVRNDAVSSTYVMQIADALGVSPRWLQDGEGDMYDIDVRVKPKGVDIQVTALPLLSEIAVIPWVDEGILPQGRVEFVTDQPVGNRAFGFHMADDSMSPVLQSGDRVVVDPARSAQPGDVVCAFADDVLIRRYRQRPGGWFELVPVNPDWPTVGSHECEGARVLGVVVEQRRYRR